ncbi:hypothetical protein ACH5RR_005818 [Cinchona calisaya]|uniref:Telomere-associated protein Rif1 N-terminal domain-containing protein n=1 Tax=Cinchona calisaya TaxID=153742 RepID=A0ABD3AMB1_9GENT
MANCSEKLEEIKKILSSFSSDTQKSHAYSTLLSIQELATAPNGSSLIHSLSDSANVFVSLIVADIVDGDEEIAAQALKCLGFMIYHPSIVSMITGDNADIIIDTLVKVITTTRIKSVCNLGVWCISIQQFSVAILDAHFHSLLRSIVYALDNPFGSLSITFEAMQAVVKLATLLGEKMRDMSNSWAPPIYRRLVSVDKREREITDRCLLKIRFLICPAPVTLSKTVIVDLRKKLLPAMKELLNLGMKIQTMQAWGWFIHFLGPYAMKSKNFVNEMLKLPEQAFSDFDPQVQISALVAWEAMIDALVLLPVQASQGDAVPMTGKRHMTISAGDNCQTDADGFLKRLKLIMTPLKGIMSSKGDLSVHVACLNTWSYLLHKLDTSISSDLAIKYVWEPILELVFQVGPDNRSLWLWNICLDLLDSFTLARNVYTNDDPNNQESSKLLEKSSVVGPLESSKCSWKHHAMKWSPWDLKQLEFFIKMIDIVNNQASNIAVSIECRRLAQSAALKLFRSLLRAVQAVVKCISVTYDDIMLCLNSVFGFLKKLCDEVNSEDGNAYDIPHAYLQLLEVAAEEIEPAVLESPLYKMALDLKCLDKLEQLGKIRSSSAPGIWLISYMDVVSPIVCLSVLYFSVAVKITSKAADITSITDRMYRHVKLSLCSCDTLEILNVFVGLLYKYEAFDCLGIWRTLANGLKDYINDRNHPSPFKMGTDNHGYSVAWHLLAYPFAICSCHQRHRQRQRLLQLQDCIEEWKLLYVSVNHDLQLECSPPENFSEDLSAVLNGYLNDITIMDESGVELHQRDKNQDTDMLSFIGKVVVCVLEQYNSRLCSRQSTVSDGNNRTSRNIKSSLKFASRFLKLAFENEEIQTLTARIISTLIQFLDSLHLKEDIVAFIEILASPLLEWLSLVEFKDKNASGQLQLIWTKVLKSLMRSRPPIEFDSSFLKFQASLLEKTLDHRNFNISEDTINFWNSTYGEILHLEYPQNLLPVLDKLSRNKKIKISKTNLAIDGKNCAGVTSTSRPQRYTNTMTTTLNSCSKRVELLGDAMNDLQGINKVHLSSKRKRPELTEHQKEVRRAQQGRVRDCSGHGPGIRTYTMVDFSQTNEESQESQEIRDADSILEMLRKVP